MINLVIMSDKTYINESKLTFHQTYPIALNPKP
jgi:hypothetical protein